MYLYGCESCDSSLLNEQCDERIVCGCGWVWIGVVVSMRNGYKKELAREKGETLTHPLHLRTFTLTITPIHSHSLWFTLSHTRCFSLSLSSFYLHTLPLAFPSFTRTHSHKLILLSLFVCMCVRCEYTSCIDYYPTSASIYALNYLLN